MKMTYKLIITAIMILSASSIKIQNKEGQDDKKPKFLFEDRIKALFNVEDTEEGECKQLEEIVNGNGDKTTKQGAEGQPGLPYKKNNPWQDYSKGESANLFDHLDDVLQESIAKTFIKIYEGASEIQKKVLSSNPSDDPYSYKNLLFGFLSGKYDGSLDENKNRLVEVLTDFNREKWDEFISYPTVKEINTQWKWVHNLKPLKDFDVFDFNGDGRLDRKEFILYSIIQNKSIFGTKAAKKEYFYDDLFSDLIDPIFTFLDCDKNGSINAEEIWTGLKKLKRKDKDKYSLFSCKLKLDMEKQYRTISVNDFVLLNSKKKNGELDLEEFRTGILLGYWKRQTRPDKIVTDSTYAYKGERWARDGKDDKMCLNIKFFMKENAKFRKSLKEQLEKTNNGNLLKK